MNLKAARNYLIHCSVFICPHIINLLLNNQTTLRNFFLKIGCFLIASPSLYSQSLRQPVAAPYIGLGAYSKYQNDVFSFTNNQAALAQVKEAGAGVYGERRFLLAATSLYAAAVAIPTSKGNFGVSMKYLGFKNFNESQLGVAYARSLGKKVAIGIQFNYYGYRVPAYNNASTINFELGAIVHLTEKLQAGVHVYNPVGGNLSKTDEKITSAYKFGLGYDASDRFFVSAEIVKEENFPVNLNAGLQYRFQKAFFMRAGIASATSTGYAGVGVSWSNIRLDITGSYHPQLGITPGLLLIMNFGKKNQTQPTADN